MRWIIAALGLLASTVANADIRDNRISFDQEWFDDRREISDKASLEDERAAAEYTYHKWVTCSLAALFGKFNYTQMLRSLRSSAIRPAGKSTALGAD